jgi:hypothetical protein
VVLSGALCDQPEGRIVLKEGQGVITEFCNVCQALIGHLNDALGQDRSRREGLGCVREVAARTLQERPGIIERIANPACLARFKRQRISTISQTPHARHASARERRDAQRGAAMQWIKGPVALRWRLDVSEARPATVGSRATVL